MAGEPLGRPMQRQPRLATPATVDDPTMVVVAFGSYAVARIRSAHRDAAGSLGRLEGEIDVAHDHSGGTRVGNVCRHGIVEWGRTERETVAACRPHSGIKEGTTSEQLRQVEEAFAALPKKIDTIVDFEWGTDVGVENLNDGFTHCFFVTFADEMGRAKYLPHPRT